MNEEETIKRLKELRELIFDGEMAVKILPEYRDKLSQRENQIRNIRIEKQTLEEENGDLKMLLRAYENEYGETFEICSACNGEGGFYFGEHSEEFDPCSCNGGIVKKEKVSK